MMRKRYFRTLPRRKPIAISRALKYDSEKLPDSSASEGVVSAPPNSISLVNVTPKVEAGLRRSNAALPLGSTNGKMQFVYCQVSGCGRRYKGERSLRQHVKVAHCAPKPKPKKESILHCHCCNKSYRTSSGLKSHMKSKNHQMASGVRGEGDLGCLNFSESGIDWHAISLSSLGSTSSVDTLPLTSQVTVGTSELKREPQLADDVRIGRRVCIISSVAIIPHIDELQQHQLNLTHIFRPTDSPPNVRRLLGNRPQVPTSAQTNDDSFTLPVRAGMTSSAAVGHDRSTAQRCLAYNTAPIDYDTTQRSPFAQSSYRLPSLNNDFVPLEDKHLE
ncbi:zinc finger, C2H2 type [Trichuris suis]|nr:zinc finger, C2H2 type [Trichuris suis]